MTTEQTDQAVSALEQAIVAERNESLDALTTAQNEARSAKTALAAAAQVIESKDLMILDLTKKLNDCQASHEPPVEHPATVAIAVLPTKGGSVYANHTAILAKLKELGARRIRHLMNANMSDQVLRFTQDAYAQGAKSWFTIGEPRVVNTRFELDKMETRLKGPLRGMVEIVFPFNEANNLRNQGDVPMIDWERKTIQQQIGVYEMIQRVNADYDTDGTEHIKVGLAALWSGDIQKQFDDLRLLVNGYIDSITKRKMSVIGYYDIINCHLYVRPIKGVFNRQIMIDEETTFRTILLDQTSPFMDSEGGFFTAPNSPLKNKSTEAEQAQLITDFGAACEEMGWLWGDFELMDDPDSTGELRECSFGVVGVISTDPSTWRNKPGFAAYQGLIGS